MEHLKADAIATGHYARTNFGPFLEHYQENKRKSTSLKLAIIYVAHISAAKLLVAQDVIKDQTLFLAQVTEKVLRKTMFPLGNLPKTEVKQIAKDNGLEKFAMKKESMGICFIGTRKFQNFIAEVCVLFCGFVCLQMFSSTSITNQAILSTLTLAKL